MATINDNDTIYIVDPAKGMIDNDVDTFTLIIADKWDNPTPSCKVHVKGYKAVMNLALMVSVLMPCYIPVATVRFYEPEGYSVNYDPFNEIGYSNDDLEDLPF